MLNQLLKYTPLQTTFGVNSLALVHGEPRLISLRRALQIYIDHRQEVITRRSRFELDKALRRAHILEGLLIALSHLDEVIATIRQSPDAEVAQQRLMERFGLTDVQAQAILDMQLRRLAALEREKVEQEYAKVKESIAFLEDLLAHPEKILGLIKEDVLYLKSKYGDARRTTIASAAAEDFTHEDLIPDEDVLISITRARIHQAGAGADVSDAGARRPGRHRHDDSRGRRYPLYHGRRHTERHAVFHRPGPGLPAESTSIAGRGPAGQRRPHWSTSCPWMPRSG